LSIAAAAIVGLLTVVLLVLAGIVKQGDALGNAMTIATIGGVGVGLLIACAPWR
jgi:hypothetical protein